MGESIVEKPLVEKKMGDMGCAAAHLEVSVSFGRFENDSLSWEKWSSFSPNKYLEEVGKCSTPGSVKQKKAYFEAHYKKIAAMKAEQLEQEKPIASPPTPTRDEAEKKSYAKHTCVADEELELSSNGRSGEDLEPEVTPKESPTHRSDEPEDKSQSKDLSLIDGKHDVLSNGRSGEDLDLDVSRNWTVNPSTFEVEKEDPVTTEDQLHFSVLEVEEELSDRPVKIESNDREEAKDKLIQNEAVLQLDSTEETAKVQVESSEKISKKNIVGQYSKDVEAKGTSTNKNMSMKFPARSSAKKMPPSNKESSALGTQNKVASPVRKSQAATKFSKDSATGLSKSTMMPASQATAKKVSRQSFPKSNYASPGGNRKAAPASLHMSLSLDTSSPLSSVMPMRKSLIMEQMGDKDIVRRAFKTFQKQFNGITSSDDGPSNRPQQTDRGSEQKVTRAMITQKENQGHIIKANQKDILKIMNTKRKSQSERLKKSAEKMNQRGDLGKRSNHISSVSHKGPGADGKKPTAESHSVRPRSDAKSGKQNEKSFTKEAEKAAPVAKTKVEKEAQMMKSRQGLNLKATVTPPYKRGDMKSRIPLQKEVNIKKPHQPASGR